MITDASGSLFSPFISRKQHVFFLTLRAFPPKIGLVIRHRIWEKPHVTVQQMLSALEAPESPPSLAHLARRARGPAHMAYDLAIATHNLCAVHNIVPYMLCGRATVTAAPAHL